jgi:hypothetical protein
LDDIYLFIAKRTLLIVSKSTQHTLPVPRYTHSSGEGKEVVILLSVIASSSALMKAIKFGGTISALAYPSLEGLE